MTSSDCDLSRDPFASILAEFNRRSGGHIGHASLEKFRKNGGKVWQEFAVNKGKEWERMNMDWVQNFPGPLLVILYTDLVQDTERALRRILEFLEISVTQEHMECVLRHKEGIYRRKKKNGNLKNHVYNSFLTSVMKKRRGRVLQYIKETNRR